MVVVRGTALSLTRRRKKVDIGRGRLCAALIGPYIERFILRLKETPMLPPFWAKSIPTVEYIIMPRIGDGTIRCY